MSRKTTPQNDVGYGKPPVHSRFEPGKSGNPAGRPKGVRNLKTDVVTMLGRPVRIKHEGRLRTGSTQAALLMVLRENALRGDGRAIDRVLDLAARFNADPLEGDVNSALSADDQAILSAFVQRVASSSTGPSDDAEKPDGRRNKGKK
jgi:hypothetical protein